MFPKLGLHVSSGFLNTRKLNKIWEAIEINLCSQCLRVKKVKIIHLLAAEKNCKPQCVFFFSGKLKHWGHTENLFFFFLRCEENCLHLTIPEKYGP